MSPSRPDIAAQPNESDSQLFVFRAGDRRELLRQVEAAAQYMHKRVDSPAWADLAYAPRGANDDGKCRLAIVASSPSELGTRLRRAAERLGDDRCQRIWDVGGIYYTAEPLARQGKLAFLFPGEGSQYLGMLDGLADRFPRLNAVYESFDRLAAQRGHDPRPISRFLLSRDRWTAAEVDQLVHDLRQIDNAMSAVHLANRAVFELLRQMDLQPATVAGHSAGEMAALAVAGVLDPDQQVAGAGGTMHGLAGRGDAASALLAVSVDRDKLVELIAVALAGDSTLQACAAMDNSPHQSVAVGAPDAIAQIETAAIERGFLCERLKLDRPYHTPWFEPCMGPLRALFAEVEFRRPNMPVYSCTTGELFPDDVAAIRELALAHWCAPVEFTRLVRNLHRDGVRIFLEVGPRNNLTSFVDDILRGQPHVAVASNVPHRSAWTQVAHMAAQLFAHHVPLRLSLFHEPRIAKPVIEAEPPSTVPSVPRSDTATPATVSPRAAIMHQHLALCQQFLELQSQVQRQYLLRCPVASNANSAPPAVPPRTPAPAPTSNSPLLGDALRHEPHMKLVMRRVLDLREDNYAGHHTVGGRRISQVDPGQHGLPIMPMTFTLEVMMEAAAALFPELTVIGVEKIRLSRWLEFNEHELGAIEITATAFAPDATQNAARAAQKVLVEVTDLFGASNGSEHNNDRSGLAATGTVVLANSYPIPPLKGDFPLRNERPCGTDVATTYNNLFHGELLMGFESVERFGDDGIEGRVVTLPRRGLFASHNSPQFVGDPVLLDVAMHPAVAWHLEQHDQSGRIMLPFELERLELYGPMPAEGSHFVSRTRIQEKSHWHYTHVTEVYDKAGRLWGKIDRVKLWRFYLPFHDVNFHGPKDVYFLAEEWPEAAPARADETVDDRPNCACVRLKELNDLTQSSLQRAAARVMLSPCELDQFRALKRPVDKRAEWLFGRAAAKDAVRILLRKRLGERAFMADVEILSDDFGRPVARPRGRERPADYPHVSIAHTAGHIAAIAATSPHLGIDIEAVVAREASFEQIAFDETERQLLGAFADRHEWITRFWCAKEAVGKALGRGLLGGPRGLVVRFADSTSGLIEITLGRELAELHPQAHNVPLSVSTWRDNDLVVATTLCEVARDDCTASSRQPQT